MRLKNHLTTKENVSYLTPLKLSEDLPDWAKKSLDKVEEIYEFDALKIPAKMNEDIINVRDFLYSRCDEYIKREVNIATQAGLKKPITIGLDYIKTINEFSDFEKTMHASKKWHELLVIQSDKIKKDKNFIKKSNEDVEKIMNFSDGFEIVRLLSSKSLDHESEVMGHCVGKGEYDKAVEDGDTKIYSLRDKNGISHVTFDVEKGILKQCKGKGNKAPSIKYRNHVKDFIEKEKLIPLNYDIGTLGFACVEDKFYDLSKDALPKGMIFDGDICLSGLGLKELPDFSTIKVNGVFDCSNNELTSLKNMPIVKKTESYIKEALYDEMLNANVSKELNLEYMFDCSNNKLKSLKYLKIEEGVPYNCSNNKSESPLSNIKKRLGF